MRILQHMLVLSVTSSSTGTVCIERKADCVLMSLLKEHLGYKPSKTAKQHVIGKDPRHGAALSNKHITPILT
jgi:hypothetical protein